MKFTKKNFIEALPERVRKTAVAVAALVPQYFYWAPASSSGKYHPAYALGNGGLARHSMSALGYLNRMLDNDVEWVFGLKGLEPADVEYLHEVLDSIEVWRFTAHEADMLRVAVAFHDGRKSGSGREYATRQTTRFDHPTLMAEAVRGLGGADAAYIADAICSHMGKWNTSKYMPGVTLDVPETDAQKLVHVADYLASRKGLKAGYTI